MDGDVDVRYAFSGDVRLAYSVEGSGPYEIVLVGEWGSNLDVRVLLAIEFWERLASFARVVRYDPRGGGLSDPAPLDPTPALEAWADDLHAVIEAAGAGQVVLYVNGGSGPVAIVYAATRPERTRGLILANTFAALAWSPDYPAGFRPDDYERFIAYADRVWGTGRVLRGLVPGVAVDENRLRELARLERAGLSPTAYGTALRQAYATDVRAVLPVITTPTLVMHTVDNRTIPVAHGRYLAEHIPAARLVELPGADQLEYVTGSPSAELAMDEIEEFVTGTRATTDHHRMLTTMLFTDVVGSTDRVATIGDRAWRTMLDRHDEAVRRQLERFSGREYKFTGDGIFAIFDGPARAIRCGTAIRDAARQIGLDVRIGIHTGEVERRGPEVAGIAVHLAERICEAAHPGEVLTSRTVVDLVAGSTISFADRGEHQLRGIPTPWQLFSVTA